MPLAAFFVGKQWDRLGGYPFLPHTWASEAAPQTDEFGQERIRRRDFREHTSELRDPSQRGRRTTPEASCENLTTAHLRTWGSIKEPRR